MEYKRLTKENLCYSEWVQKGNPPSELYYVLRELEDKIENETLIEIDHSLIGQGIIGIHHFNDVFRNGMFFIDNGKGRAKAEQRLKEVKQV